MIKLLIGGSPCTFWSIAQKNGRETEAEGMGWELFKNYLIAKDKFKPDFFLYENNKSASKAIKDQIKQELKVWDGSFLTEDTGARYIEINSALVSAQNRQRFYVHNCGEVEQPEDRGILLKDILESGCGCNVCDSEKAHTIKAQYFKNGIANFVTNGGFAATGVAEPIRIPPYSVEKSRPCVASYANKSATSGSLESNCFPANPNKQVWDMVAEPIDLIGQDWRNDDVTIYKVEDGFITINNKKYTVNLANGYYIIRKLTVAECCRLQTMPDDYCRVVSNTQAYKGIGNGWTAEVIIHILQNALKDVPKDEEIVVLSMYDGIGTGRYCLDKMGFTNVKYYAYEIDKYAKQIAMSNYPDIIQMGDAFDLRNPNWEIKE